MRNRGPWIKTFTGKKFHFLDPMPDDICIEDIAHALAFQSRFGGHVKQFYSVAEHSINVSKIAPRGWEMSGLLHDASEAYLVDIPRPIKRTLNLEGYRTIETKVQGVIDFKFDTEHCGVKPEDNIILAHEIWQLMEGPEEYEVAKPEKLIELACWSPTGAEVAFLERFKELTSQCVS